MKVIKTLILIQGVALIFLLFPSDVIIQPFPFYKVPPPAVMYLQTYVWMICSEHVNWIIMYWIVLSLVSSEYKPAILLFGIMEVVYLIEFLLNYNQTWFSLPMVGQIGMSHLFIIFKGMIFFLLWRNNK